MYDLNSFGLKEMAECGAVLRNMGADAKSMEETANRIIHYLYDQLVDMPNKRNGFVLIRLFKTHPYGDLHKDLQDFARGLMNKEHESPEVKCLTLLATAGELPDWNKRENSKGHKAIPLVSEKFVSAFPMISNLTRQLGLEINQVVSPRPDILLDLSKRKYNVFYIPDALGNPIIPVQNEFVIPLGVESVIGFGGVFPSGNLFAIIGFTKIKVKQEVVDLFKTLALHIKVALLPFEDRVFA